MVKLKNPLMSGDARGKFGNNLIYTRGGQARRYFKPRNPNSAAQRAQREAFKEFSVPGLTQEQADLLYATIAHLHDDRYSQLGHLHDDRYSQLGHLHDDRYSQLTHLHDDRYLQTSYDGWIAYTAAVPTLIASADPSYTLQLAGVNAISILQEGRPVKWTQNGIDRYGWINKQATYANGNTSFSVLTRTDGTSVNYDVLNTSTYSITNFSLGLLRQPGLGFPALRENWRVDVPITTAYKKTNPNVNQWYRAMDSGNLPSISLPSGRWDLGWYAAIYGEVAANFRTSCLGTLSTSSSSESDKYLTDFVSFSQVGSGAVYIYATGGRRKDVTITTPTDYYFLLTSFTQATYIGVDNTSSGYLRAECLYL